MSKRQSGGEHQRSGIVLIDKERDWTSHDVVAKLRGIFRQRRIGHTGTLDPAATGLLVVCLGQATRLVEYMTASTKEYIGEVALGVTTDTDDAEGTVTATAPVPDITEALLRELETGFSGHQMQRPPAYSAIKVGGVRAYRAARRGDDVDLQPRPVQIHELHLEQTASDRIVLRLRCGPGTYVRSLARDIGERLGCGGHLASLRRTASGHYGVERAHTIDAVARLATEGAENTVVLPADDGVATMDAAIVSAGRAAELARGQRPSVRIERAPATPEARVYTTDGTFVAVASVDERGQLIARKVLLTPDRV